MGEQRISDTHSMPQHKDVTFVILFDESNQDGLEVTKSSIETQKQIKHTILTCSPQGLQDTKESIVDDCVVIILRSGDRFSSNNSCLQLISHINQDVQCIYCDSIITDGNDEMLQLMFPFSLQTMSSGYMITNLILSSEVFKSLAINEKLNFLLGHDLILKACQVTNVRHVADVNFTVPSRAINVEHEIPFVGSMA